MANISAETMSALRTMGEQTHTNRVMGNHRSVFAECQCTKCLDGGICRIAQGATGITDLNISGG